MDFKFGRRSIVAETGRESSDPEFSPAPEKYSVVAPIGSGGMGEVLLVQDHDLRRDVAMKVLRDVFADDASMRRKFVAEAQATSQLEHPGIPPVHDLGLAENGHVYFTMKVVRGETLAGVLKKLVLGAKDARQEYTLHKLVTVMERIAEAVHFAHEKGVIHRDLKPENVMLGEFGEVHVMDWGIAKVATTGDDETTDSVRTAETDAALLTQVGSIKGTIPYMSPEQARGEPLDRRTDVWALGAVLYEVLTLHPAFEGGGVQLVLKVRTGEFPPVETRNPRRPVPEALAALCRRAMSKDVASRPATAREFGDALRAWLDGRAERERRHREAEALAAQGREAMGKYVAAKDAIEGAERTAAELVALFKPWQSVEAKAEAIDARQAVEAARRRAVLAFAETTRLLEGALLAESDNAAARATLAELWRGRLDDAERRSDAADTDFALTMVRRYDDGRLAAYVAGDGLLELSSDPPGAAVSLRRFEDRRGVLHLGEPRHLGTTPLAPLPLAMGSYLCVLTMAGRRDVRCPVHVVRGGVWKGTVTIRSEREIGAEFVVVPGGPFVYGEGRDTRVLELPDFAIARSPVTFGDWAEFLAAVEEQEGPEAAAALCPRTPGDGPLMERADDATWRMKAGVTSGPAESALVARHGAGFEIRCPVTAISWHDAAAYCAWKSKTTGSEWRLPTQEEREKAARGVDGRRFPWGDIEDASLGKCMDSREEPTQPEPVGSFPTATSVYGMLDAAGNTFDWTDSWQDARRSARVVRGGSWSFNSALMRCACRSSLEPGFRFTSFGLRAARSL